MRRTLLLGPLVASACVFPTDEPTGIEFSWQFREVSTVDQDDDEDAAPRILTCAGATVDRIAAHVVDVDSPERQGTFRFGCDDGFQTAEDAQLAASGAFVQLHPGDYDVSLAIETPGGADELLGARTVEVLSRSATLELWELQRAPVDWVLVLDGAESCTEVGVALYYDAPAEALAQPPLDSEGEPLADVLYREAATSDRGLGLAGTSLACDSAAGAHLFSGIDRGGYRLDITVDGVTCPLALSIAPSTTTTIDLGALPCG
ncbi:MAG TPA: hypothetical protein VFG69_18130 [Nannocystaceae bacterium]|nr:hypothetical protein [Nannocystaceae bacterium]